MPFSLSRGGRMGGIGESTSGIIGPLAAKSGGSRVFPRRRDPGGLASSAPICSPWRRIAMSAASRAMRLAPNCAKRRLRRSDLEALSSRPRRDRHPHPRCHWRLAKTSGAAVTLGRAAAQAR
jgi:hypothetical protein